MHPFQHARLKPDHPAIIMAETGETVSYRTLEARSNRFAHLFRARGLMLGDVIALLMKNSPDYLIATCGAMRAGLLVTPLSTHLKTAEAAYVLDDCGAKLLLLSTDLGETAAAIARDRKILAPRVADVFSAGPRLAGANDLDRALAQMPETRIADEISGHYLVYSSGTTGRPKGVVHPYTRGPIEADSPFETGTRERYGIGEHDVYLSPAPLYHAAPFVGCFTMHRLGGTTVVMQRFDAEEALSAIERYRVTYSQMVPTMFVRLLKPPPATRARYDLSSLKIVTHAAAPCPVEVKRRMMEWLGPIIYEYYSGSENNGQCFIRPEEWLEKPGSVGRARVGTLHICDDDGRELSPREVGLVYFEGGGTFTYRNDPEKTAQSRHPQHTDWSTLGDMGYVDEDGYLFLTDRKDFTIISGGVNIYPRAAEDVLVTHPKVADAAVIGVPHDEFGVEVKAVVEPVDWTQAGAALEAELIAYCRARLAAPSCPKSIDFSRELPRLPTGKLAKRHLKERYWKDRASKIV